jgi:hypothetical protein
MIWIDVIVIFVDLIMHSDSLTCCFYWRKAVFQIKLCYLVDQNSYFLYLFFHFSFNIRKRCWYQMWDTKRERRKEVLTWWFFFLYSSSIYYNIWIQYDFDTFRFFNFNFIYLEKYNFDKILIEKTTIQKISIIKNNIKNSIISWYYVVLD